MLHRKTARPWPKRARGEYLANWLIGLALVALAIYLTVDFALYALG